MYWRIFHTNFTPHDHLKIAIVFTLSLALCPVPNSFSFIIIILFNLTLLDHPERSQSVHFHDLFFVTWINFLWSWGRRPINKLSIESVGDQTNIYLYTNIISNHTKIARSLMIHSKIATIASRSLFHEENVLRAHLESYFMRHCTCIIQHIIGSYISSSCVAITYLVSRSKENLLVGKIHDQCQLWVIFRERKPPQCDAILLVCWWNAADIPRITFSSHPNTHDHLLEQQTPAPARSRCSLPTAVSFVGLFARCLSKTT